jgi:anti-sigma factor RsiW
MAPDQKSDEILLNALVDGELDASGQAAAAARLATDREFARAYAALTQLKASVVEIAESEQATGIRLPALQRSRHVAIGISIAAAATIALAIFAVRVVPVGEVPRTANTVVEQAIKVGFSAEPVIPDLAPAGLRLARTVVTAESGRQALVATYVGPRGCRLELWVSEAPVAAKSDGASERHRWQTGGLHYALVAYGMPSARFQKVAEAAEDATRAMELPESVDDRLIEARASTAPCLA